MLRTLSLKRVAAGAMMMALITNVATASPQQTAVDDSHALLESAIETAGFDIVASIDHARLAAAESVEMPPSRVLIFSDADVSAPILRDNIRAGLDLPFRVLSYADKGSAKVVYTGAEFLQVRHGLTNTAALEDFDDKLNEVTKNVSAIAAPIEGLTRNYGIIELESKLSVSEAVASLTKTVRGQDDTIWFGEVRFSEAASEAGEQVPEAVLLLFGGPAPGGVAMADFPAIGLDAFCQKLLVYTGDNGGSVVIFNDIAAFAELHYGASAKPHHALNERLTATFTQAIQ